MPGFHAPEPEKGLYGTAAILPIFKDECFPISKNEVMEKYGDRTVEYTSGETMKIRDIIQDYPDDTFHSPAEIEQAFHLKLSEG